MGETNAKNEFMNVTKYLKVINASIWKRSYDTKKDYIDLLEGYSKEDYEKFLAKLDFIYDGGYGGQDVYGFIGCEDGVWFDRGEYNGSEWWEKHQYPNIENMIKGRILDKLEEND